MLKKNTLCRIVGIPVTLASTSYESYTSFFGTSLLASLVFTFHVLCIALPYFLTKLPSQDTSVLVCLSHTPTVTPPISSTAIPELPGVEYFTFIIQFWKYLFYFTCVVERIVQTISRLPPPPPHKQLLSHFFINLALE